MLWWLRKRAFFQNKYIHALSFRRHMCQLGVDNVFLSFVVSMVIFLLVAC